MQDDFKIWICMLCYNDNDLIRASLGTAIGFADKAIVIDGKFSYVDGEVESTDGTIETVRELQEAYPDKIDFMWAREYKTEVEKRNVYMDKVPVGDWMWILDPDDIPFGLLQRVRVFLSVWPDIGANVYIRHPFLYRHPLKALRLIKKTEGMRYEGVHYHIVDGKGLDVTGDHWATKEVLPIWHIEMGALRDGGKTFKRKSKFKNSTETIEAKFAEMKLGGQFYCVIPDCDKGAIEQRLNIQGMAYLVSLCREHKIEFLQQPMLDVINKYGESDRNMKIKIPELPNVYHS